MPNAQVIFIKPNLGNCVKCALKLQSYFDVKRTRIPTFLVFGTSATSDSTEIETSLQNRQMGARLIFSDKMLRQFKGESDVLYINSNGEVLFQKKLFVITEADLRAMIDAYKEDYRFLSVPSKSYKVDGDQMLAVDKQVGSAILFAGKDTFLYKVNEEMHGRIKVEINKIYPDLFGATERFLVEEPKSKLLIKLPKGSFSLHGDDVYLSATVSYMDSVDSENLDLRKVYVLLRFNRDICNIYPINLPYLVPSEFRPKDYSLPDSMANTFYGGRVCTVKDDSTFIFTFTGAQNPKPRQMNRFLAEFKLRNGVLEYDRQLDVDLPELYKQSNIAYPDPYTYTSQFRIDYPYYTTAIYPSLIDLSTEKSYTYPLPFNYGVPDTAKLDIETSLLQNFYVYKDLKRKYVYILSLINGRLSLQVLQVDKSVVLKKIVDLQDFGILNKPTNYFQIVAEKNMVYAADAEGYVRGYPLGLFLGE